MEEVEQFFTCPYCLEEISMLLDPNVEGSQSYIEDCEVCCQPIQISFESEDGEILNFMAVEA
ncbi:MAG: CPXCG motif-containing cysteine-rich protein [Bdellovibrionaceae bacterium]|nr:CPXCG motif-containing cysteine-rich protein [Pseudobdellovibrionaceae bacterium]